MDVVTCKGRGCTVCAMFRKRDRLEKKQKAQARKPKKKAKKKK
jgi:hypothetical protein